MVIEFYNAHLPLQMEECGGTCVESMLNDLLTDHFFGRTDPFTTGIPASHSTVVIIALSPALNNPPPWAAQGETLLLLRRR